MKKIAFLFGVICVFLFTCVENSYAASAFRPQEKGLNLYANVTLPNDAANNLYNAENALSNLKKGEAKARNILWLVELGDAGIDTAAKNGDIHEIKYVDTKIKSIFIPLIIIPIYFKETTTIVYGE